MAKLQTKSDKINPYSFGRNSGVNSFGFSNRHLRSLLYPVRQLHHV